jgi:hypothetical protein
MLLLQHECVERSATTMSKKASPIICASYVDDMNREDLERYLERGDTLGFKKKTANDDVLGWILLSKAKPHDRYLALLEEGEEPEFVAEQERYRRTPYLVLVQELKREAYESERYETNEDYLVNEAYFFSNLDEVEEFLLSYGRKLEDIKWPIEIGMP